MKFSKLSQLALVAGVSLLVASLLAGCYLVTIDYIFVATSANTTPGSQGQIYAYAVDAESGAIRNALGSVSSGGINPVAMATTSDYYNLYVANQGSNTVVHFAIQTDGTLTKMDSVTLTAPPVALAVNAANTYLYVVSGSSSATLTEYPLNSAAIGNPVQTVNLSLNCSASQIANYPSDAMVPTGIAVLPNSGAVFVAAYDQSAYNPNQGVTTPSNANPGWIFGMTVGSGGALAPAAKNCASASGVQPYDVYEAGVRPSSLAIDPTGRFVYITDYASNTLIGYSVFSTDALTLMIDGPYKTGNEPTAVLVDPRGLYVYVTNSLDNTVSAYAITLATGAPTTVVNTTGTATNNSDSSPVALTIEPSLGRFLFTANRLGDSVSGFRINPDNGALSITEDTPYPTGIYPMAVVAVPHGNHATQTVAP